LAGRNEPFQPPTDTCHASIGVGKYYPTPIAQYQPRHPHRALPRRPRQAERGQPRDTKRGHDRPRRPYRPDLTVHAKPATTGPGTRNPTTLTRPASPCLDRRHRSYHPNAASPATPSEPFRSLPRQPRAAMPDPAEHTTPAVAGHAFRGFQAMPGHASLARTYRTTPRQAGPASSRYPPCLDRGGQVLSHPDRTMPASPKLAVARLVLPDADTPALPADAKTCLASRALPSRDRPHPGRPRQPYLTPTSRAAHSRHAPREQASTMLTPPAVP
jgi:hypothetical protein